MDVPKHVLDTPKTVALFLSCFCFKFYRLPTTRCENNTIRHVFLSSFTVYRHEKNATVFGVSGPLYILHFFLLDSENKGAHL